jgi:ABC-type uncharacterized transport system auxiliary subunit
VSRSGAWRLLLSAIVVAALAACAQPLVPRDHFYRLNAVGQVPAFRDPPLVGTVTVSPLRADGLVSQRPVLFSHRDEPLELRQYNYHYWVEPPPILLQRQLIDHLRAANVATTVASPDLRGAAGCRVLGSVRRFERIVGPEPSRIAVELDLILVRAGDAAELLSTTLRADMQAGDERMESVILAFDAAVTRLFNQFVAELRQIPTRCGPARRES